MRFVPYLLCLFAITAYAVPYQKIRDDHCWWCGGTNKVEWAHEMSQTTYPAIKNDRLNGVTLDRRCHEAFHQFNFKNNEQPWLREVVVAYGWITNHPERIDAEFIRSINNKP